MKTRPFKLTPKSQVSIPDGIKKFLGIKAGDAICFQVEGNHVFILPSMEKEISIFDLGHKYKTTVQRKVSIDDMDEAIRKGRSKIVTKKRR